MKKKNLYIVVGLKRRQTVQYAVNVKVHIRLKFAIVHIEEEIEREMRSERCSLAGTIDN